LKGQKMRLKAKIRGGDSWGGAVTPNPSARGPGGVLEAYPVGAEPRPQMHFWA